MKLLNIYNLRMTANTTNKLNLWTIILILAILGVSYLTGHTLGTFLRQQEKIKHDIKVLDNAIEDRFRLNHEVQMENVQHLHQVFNDGGERINHNQEGGAHGENNGNGKPKVTIKQIKDIDDVPVPENAYTFTAKCLSPDYHLHPTVGNGHLATVVHGPYIHMNGLYNGRLGDSHRAIIPTTCDVTIEPTLPTQYNRTFQLNARQGVYTEIIKSESFVIYKRIFAHRDVHQLVVVEIEVTLSDPVTALYLSLNTTQWTTSPDLDFRDGTSGIANVSYKIGKTKEEETNASSLSMVHIYFDNIPSTVHIPSNGTRYTFLSSISTTEKDAWRAFQAGRAMVKSNTLLSNHTMAWENIWSKGNIEVWGDQNNTLSQAIYGSMYYLLSSLPTHSDPLQPFIGLSPGGLPFGTLGNAYQGHVFWDQETWMFPSVLMLHPDIGKTIISTRSRTILQARENARMNRNKGLQYPWESAFTGAEVCPVEDNSLKEIHISGDVAQAVLQYLYATNDSSILSPPYQFLELLAGVADFWVSKLVYNDTLQLYTILDVIPPDEYQRGVNNSAYTNSIAQLSLEAAIYAHNLVKKDTGSWDAYVNKIHVPFDEKLHYHPEFDGYTIGTKIKQADVVLLGYPLMRNMTKQVRYNDLHLYEQVTDPGGPAMTWAMHTIGWLELGNKTRAAQLFERNFDYINNQFQVWTETSDGGGCPNFLTGIGGFLQSLIFGYSGIRLHADRLFLFPTLPPTEGVWRTRITGLDYLGYTFDIITSDGINVMVTSIAPGSSQLLLTILYNPVSQIVLKQGLSVRYHANTAAYISVFT